MREPDDGQEDERTQEQAPIDPGEHDQAADELHDRPPRVVDHAVDEVADVAWVLAQQAGGAARFELVDAVQGQVHRVIEDAPAKTAEPRVQHAASQAT